MSVVSISRLSIGAAVVLAGALGIQTCRLSDSHARLARETVERTASELRGAGFAPAEIDRPDRPADVPREATPILMATGTARWGPVAGRQAGAPGMTAAGTERTLNLRPLDSAPPDDRPPCDLGDLDVSVTCRTEAVLLDGLPWVRTLASGRIAAWDQVRELPEIVTGESRSKVAPSILPPRWRLDLLGGASAGPDRIGIEAGAAWTGRGRLGGYALGEWLPATSTLPADWRLHGGLRVRVR